MVCQSWRNPVIYQVSDMPFNHKACLHLNILSRITMSSPLIVHWYLSIDVANISMVRYIWKNDSANLFSYYYSCIQELVFWCQCCVKKVGASNTGVVRGNVALDLPATMDWTSWEISFSFNIFLRIIRLFLCFRLWPTWCCVLSVYRLLNLK